MAQRERVGLSSRPAWLLVLVLLLGVLAGCSRIHTANYNKVTVGMSLQEVESLLGNGEPLAIEDAHLAVGNSGDRSAGAISKARVWTNSGAGLIIVLFQEDKVA